MESFAWRLHGFSGGVSEKEEILLQCILNIDLKDWSFTAMMCLIFKHEL